MRNLLFFYPKLSNIDLGFIRIGGPGLANCMFFVAQAYVASLKQEGIFISPTWKKFSIGPIIRKEKDKRIYNDLFKSYGIKGLRKVLFLIKAKIIFGVEGGGGRGKILLFNTLDDYFKNLHPYQKEISKFFFSIINPKAIEQVKSENLKDMIAIHVRLGDYLPHLRVPINWYKNIINEILRIKPDQKFTLFSDGTDEELVDLIDLPNVKKAFYGNALADMVAISKCKLVIGSDSTFSAWGAFLGNVPIIFNKRHFPPVYDNEIKEWIMQSPIKLPNQIQNIIL